MTGDIPAGGFAVPEPSAVESDRVVIRGDVTGDGQIELFSALIGEADTLARINQPLEPGGSVRLSVGTPESASTPRVVYVADAQAGNRQLFSALTDGSGTPIQLSTDRVDAPDAPPSDGGDVDARNLPRFTPDGARVLFLGDLTTEESFDLYAADVTNAGSQIRLTGDTGRGAGTVNEFAVSDDGSSVLFLADYAVDNAFDLYAASTTATGTQQRLSILSGDEEILDFALSSDRDLAVYSLSTDGFDAANELRAVWIATGESFRLNGPIEGGNTIGDFLIAPDSRTVLYQSSIDAEGFDFDLFSVTVTEVPEPGTAILAGAGLLLLTRRRRVA